MLKLAVIAYCAENLGDDLFLQLLSDRYPDCDISLVSVSEDSLGRLRDIRRLSCVDLATFRSNAKDYDALVVLGGSMFQQRRGWLRSWVAYARRFRIASRAGVPIFVIGASFGPFSTARYPFAFRQLFRQCEWVSFRDAASASLFTGLSATRWYPDLAFGYDVSTIERPIVRPGGPIGISVMEFGSGKHIEDYTLSVSNLITALAGHRPVKIFSFQDTSAISDARAAEAALATVPPGIVQNVGIYRYRDLGIDGLLGEMATCSAVVSTRFHAMVTAAVLGKPVVSIGYHSKVAATINALGLAIPVLEAGEISETSKILKLLAHSETSGPVDMSGLATLARQHFNGLDRLVGARDTGVR